jgi:hypothetical protein
VQAQAGEGATRGYSQRGPDDQNILLDGAEGDKDAYGHGLRLLRDMHDVMQPSKDEAKGSGGPFLAKFNRPNQPGSAASPFPPSDPVPPNSVVDADGSLYVESE